MVSQNDRELLIAAYTNFNARAIEAILESMHPDVDWPNGMEGGRVLGRDGVREYWTRQWGLINPHVEPISFSSGETGSITVSVHLVVHDLAGKALVDEMVEHVYRIESGLIRRMDIGSQPG